MKTPTVAACGRQGCVFEGQVAHTFCFVPEELIWSDDHGVHIAEGDYVRGGWDVRNMRCNETPDGQRLFPDSGHPLADLTSLAVRTFLGRIQRVSLN